MQCTDYKYKLWHLFFVHPDIFKKMCLSYDKTELFIIGLIRVTIYVILLYFLLKLKKQMMLIPFYFIVGFSLLLNLIALVIILMKQQLIASESTKKFIMKLEEKPTEELINKVRIRPNSTSHIPDFFFETVIYIFLI